MALFSTLNTERAGCARECQKRRSRAAIAIAMAGNLYVLALAKYFVLQWRQRVYR